jgi:transposase
MNLPKEVLAGRLAYIEKRSQLAHDWDLRTEIALIAHIGINPTAREEIEIFEKKLGFSLSKPPENTEETSKDA